MMNTVKKISEGKQDTRMNYVLNDKVTATKLKKAAKNKDIVVEDNDGSKNVLLSTGSYIATVLPLVSAWKDMEGGFIPKELVDEMVIFVEKVKQKQEKAAKIVSYLVRLKVQGQVVNIHLYDTKLSMLGQAANPILDIYCTRVLIPYLQEQCKQEAKYIKDLNSKALSVEKPNTASKIKHRDPLEGPPTRRAPRTASSEGPPVLQDGLSAAPEGPPAALEGPQGALALPAPADLAPTLKTGRVAPQPPGEALLAEAAATLTPFEAPRTPSRSHEKLKNLPPLSPLAWLR